MRQSDPGLAIGTVQFGVAYGVAGRGEAVPDAEVTAILVEAARAGVSLLDTAPAYGNIESRLASLAGSLPFSMVSKIPPIPENTDGDGATRSVEASIERSATRLGSRLTTLLFHRADDLLGRFGDIAWRTAEKISAGRFRLGASCYDPAALIELRRRYPIVVGQLPGNALDQRLAVPGVAAALDGVELHLRSVFLQGLLLIPPADAARRVPAAADAVARWTSWCAERRLRPIVAALGIARALPGVRRCLVGVDRLEQLREIVDAWAESQPLVAPALACDIPDVIDPRRWSLA